MPGLFDDIPVQKPQQKGLFDDIPVAKQAAPTAPAASPGILDPRSVRESLQRAITPSNQKVVSAIAQEPGRMIEGMLNLPKAAFEASEEYRKGGEYNAAPIVDAALLGVAPSVAGKRPIPTPRAGEAPKPPLEAPKPAPGAAAAKPTEPPLEPGAIRFYHGTAYKDASGFTGSTFVTPHYQYARDYHGGPNNVLYTDLTKEEAIKQGLYDEINNTPRNGSIDDGATRLKPLEAAPEAPKPAGAATHEPWDNVVARAKADDDALEENRLRVAIGEPQVSAPVSSTRIPKEGGPPGGGPPPGKGLFDDIPAATPPIKEQVVNLSDDLQRIKQSGVADRAEIGNRIAQAPKEVLDKDLQEKFYHAIEDPKKMIALTPQERTLFRQHVQPLRDEATQLYNTIKKLGGEKMVDDPTYVHRIAKGHAPQYDTLSGEAANPVAGTRSLNKKTSALQERKFYAIENDQGKRFVVSKDADGGVSVWKDGKPTKIKKEGDLEPGGGMEIGGQDWEIKQARTSEIEANSSVRYYKNAMLNTADAVVRMREVARNLEFLEKTKASPWWLENATRVGGNQRPPAGWRQPKLPQLHDWFVNPKLANVLDDFYKPGVFDADSAIRKINQFATGSMFWQPLPHIENVAAHWFTGRGWDWIRPGPIRHFANDAGRAIQAVVTQNKLYQDFLREGSGLVYGGVKNADFYQEMGKRFGMDIEKNWGAWHPIAKKIGMHKPGEFIAWWYGKVRNVLWAANDMFMMHRYLELQRKGVSSRAAIKEAEKHIPNYRIPSEVLGSRTFSQILHEPGITIFSPYHYGMWKSYMHMVTDMAKGATKEKIEALGNIAALGFLIYGVYSGIDYALQKLTGDPKAKKLRRGSAFIPEQIKELYDGDLTFPQFLSNTITLAPVTKELVSLSNFWDRRPDVQRLDDLAKTMISPYATARQFMDSRSGGRSAGRAALDIAIGAKNTSERTEKGKRKGKRARNTQTRKYIRRLEKDVGGAVDKVKSVFGGAVE